MGKGMGKGMIREKWILINIGKLSGNGEIFS